MKDLSKEVLNTIKKTNIKPIPKWHFLLKEYVIWGLFVVSIIVGAIGFGISTFLIRNSELLSDPTIGQSLIERILYGVPLLWLLLTFIFALVAFYNFRYSSSGYKYSTFIIFISSIGLSLLLGIFLHFTGTARIINTFLGERVPFYTHTMDMREKIWLRPEDGFIAGTIIDASEEYKKNGYIILTDLNDVNWIVNIDKANIKPRVNIQKGEQIKIIGTLVVETGSNHFVAKEIRPMAPPQGRRNGF